MYAPVNLKSNTTYNVSYYTKGITGCNSLGIVSQLSGTSSLGNPILSTATSPNTISNPTWQRYITTLTTPISGSNFNLILTLKNLSSGAINPALGVAAIQVTEGQGAVPYKDNTNIVANTVQSASFIGPNTPFAWVSFNGAGVGTQQIYASYNVSSVVGSQGPAGGTAGYWTVNFATPAPNLNYAINGNLQGNGVKSLFFFDISGIPTSLNQFTFRTLGSTIGSSPLPCTSPYITAFFYANPY